MVLADGKFECLDGRSLAEMVAFSVTTLVSTLVELCVAVGCENRVGVDEPVSSLEPVPVVSVVVTVVSSTAVIVDPDWSVALSDVVPTMPFWLLLSVDSSVGRIRCKLQVELLCVAVDVLLCVDVDEATPSADEVIMEPTLLEVVVDSCAPRADLDSCAPRADSVLVVCEEAVKPPSECVEK